MAEPPHKKRKLPTLPEAFSTQSLATDSPDFHQGRTRAVPHTKGQWAAHIYLELEPTDALRRALAKAAVIATGHTSATVHSLFSSTPQPAVNSTPPPETSDTAAITHLDSNTLHLSLSRPLLLQTSQRLELRTAVAAVARSTTGFPSRFASFGVLENDELTRRFLGIEIGTGYAHLKSFVHDLDLALIKMRLPPYYDQPRFHTSLLWSTTTSSTKSTKPGTCEQVEIATIGVTVSTKESQPPSPSSDPPKPALPFSEDIVATLDAQLGRALRADEFYVAQVCVRIGKEVKRFPLAS